MALLCCQSGLQKLCNKQRRKELNGNRAHRAEMAALANEYKLGKPRTKNRARHATHLAACVATAR